MRAQRQARARPTMHFITLHYKSRLPCYPNCSSENICYPQDWPLVLNKDLILIYNAILGDSVRFLKLGVFV